MIRFRTVCVLLRTGSAACASLLVASCTLTPQPQTPEIVEEIRALQGFGNASGDDGEPMQRAGWWTRIGGDELGELVEILKQDSLVLAEASLQADQSRELVRQARGARLPAASLTADATSTRRQGLDGQRTSSDDYVASLAVGFDSDSFGKLRSTQRAAQLNAMAAELSFQAAQQREIAALARSWVSAVSLRRRLDLAKTTADSFRTTYELTDQRYRAGSPSSSASDVQIALQNYDTARVDIPELAASLKAQFLVIDEQLARLPGKTDADFEGQFRPEFSVAVPEGGPASLLANRPDVAAAELRYRAALEDVGAARANLYPAMSLSAALTFQGDASDELFDWDRHIASLASALFQPVYQGGRLRSQVRLEKARAEELATAFARTTLAAVIDVEIRLADLAGLSEQRQRLEDAVASAQTSNDVAQTRYRQGLTSILGVLETQRSLNNAQQNLILTEQALLNAQIDLFLSLGGDWSN